MAKILVACEESQEVCKAFPQSRYGGGREFVIWEKGAADYWDYK